MHHLIYAALLAAPFALAFYLARRAPKRLSRAAREQLAQRHRLINSHLDPL